MNLTAWLIGDDAEIVLKDLTAPDGRPPAHIWIPLESEPLTASNRLPKYRSAWAYRTADDQQWIDFDIPAETILAAIGPCALAHPNSLTHGVALRSNVATRDGALMVKVPRYFSSITGQYSLEPIGQRPLVTLSGHETTVSTIGELDRDTTFGPLSVVPDLVVDHRGPRLLKAGKALYYNVSGITETSRVMNEIRKLPGETPIRAAWCAS